MNSSSAQKIFTALVLLTILGCQSSPKVEESAIPHSDILWNKISTQCVPNQKQNHNPAPCEEVTYPKNDEQGFVVMKDIKGRLQYLLLPTQKITGVEDPQVLQSKSLHYFNEAWKARSYMSKKNGSLVPDENISLAMNSALGRSQNQLHIHISCIRPDVRAEINQHQSSLSREWEKFPAPIRGHDYYARKISVNDLKTKNVFFLISDQLTDAKDEMKKFGIALVPILKEGKVTSFVLLAEKADPSQMNFASAEEIQDHDCPQVK